MPPELSKIPSEFVVKARMVGKRIDAYLTSRYPDYSRSVIQKVIDADAVLINGQPTKASYKVREGDHDSRLAPRASPSNLPPPEDIPIGDRSSRTSPSRSSINLAGLVTHPAKGNWTGTLVNALQFHFDALSTRWEARTDRGSSTDLTATLRVS